MMKHLWVMRHSIRADLANNLDPQADPTITQNGVDLARKTGAEIQQKINGVIDVVECSPYLRAYYTALSVCPETNVKININAKLAECALDANNKNVIPDEPLLSFLKNNNITFPESQTSMKVRCTQFLDEFVESDHTIVLAVTHGAIVNEILSLIDGSVYDAGKPAQSYSPSYCGYIGLTYDTASKKWTVIEKSWQ
jgi:broad specificity phosphatase PhoE